MAPVIDRSRIENVKPRQLVAYFNQLRHDGITDSALTQVLFEAGTSADIVAIVFLTWTHNVDVIVRLAKHASRLSVRHLAIRRVGKLLADERSWKSTWMALGDVQGLVTHLARISVIEVKLFSMAIGFGRAKAAMRENAVERLLKALLPRNYPESQPQSEDKRPIHHHYARMLHACSATFVDDVLESWDDSNPLYKHCSGHRLIKSHPDLMRRRAEAILEGETIADERDQPFINAFLERDPTFAEKAVQTHPSDQNWPYKVPKFNVLLSHLRRMVKKRHCPDAAILPKISLALQVGRDHSHNDPSELWSILCNRWWKQPRLYEEQFVSALRQGLKTHQHKIGEGYFIFGSASVEIWDWDLLRLYCLHVPGIEMDLDTAIDYSPLAKRPWVSDIFFKISKEQATRVLARLYEVNPDYNFLETRSGSILQVCELRALNQKNFNVDLLLAMLQRDNHKAETRVDRLQQKASTVKDQEHRAQLARAASDYAIASGSLELYKQTIIWQQRFVRDPLTMKTLSSRSSVMSREGIELLCGIPEVSKGMTLAELAVRVEKGTAILTVFYETMLLSKQEPSFNVQDWSVSALIGAVFRKRIAHAKNLQQNKSYSRADVFIMIWETSLELADKLQGDLAAISDLFVLSPEDLVTVTKAMLHTGEERRKNKSRQPEDTILEHLSYHALGMLASGEKPQLAKQLILQTIMDRPDASTWHRRLLSIGFMKRLPAEDAQDLLLSFAAAIGAKLEEQSYIRVGEPEPSKTAPPASMVKVTTVKYLAQLLDNAEYISADAAVEILVELFKVGTHPDIRLAALDSLLSSLNDICNGEWRSNSLTEKIMGALEIVIPIAGSINERRPPLKADWQQTMEGTLPEISDIAETPPLLAAILDCADSYLYPNLREIQSEFVTRLILPIVVQSCADHGRWISAFETKHRASIKSTHVPKTPITPLVWETVLTKYPHLIPSQVLEDYFRYLITTLDPPPDLSEFEGSLESNPKLRNTPEVQHWLRVFGHSTDNYHTVGVRQLFDITDRLRRHSCFYARGIDMTVEFISRLLDNHEAYPTVWSGIVTKLQPPLHTQRHGVATIRDTDEYRAWLETRRPILARVSALIVEKRRKRGNPLKKLAKQRGGGMLPMAAELQVLLLPYPLSRNEDKVEAERKTFAVELDELILTALHGETNVLQWAKVADVTGAISKLLTSDMDRLQLAYRIGRLKKAKIARGTSPQLQSALHLVKLRTAFGLLEHGCKALDKGLTEDAGLERRLAERLQSLGNEWWEWPDETVTRELMAWWRTKAHVARYLSTQA